ncbi:hypothetical protein NPIL_402071 [Nephila pilipes]|uniref:Uncharacterized protein n=1 Tax=Nephila pilipes TaxID=299642 RepID=A0A8X6UG71_NEPPI|nr:hypothetical protein NPIL_402071 [Nephila pilipes]
MHDIVWYYSSVTAEVSLFDKIWNISLVFERNGVFSITSPPLSFFRTKGKKNGMTTAQPPFWEDRKNTPVKRKIRNKLLFAALLSLKAKKEREPSEQLHW